MKKGIIFVLAALLVFSSAACSPANTANPGQNGQQANDGSIRGIVSAVNASAIEIAKMEGGNRQGNPPSGSPDKSRQPQNNGQAPNGTPQAQPSFDTSKMEKGAYTIDANTKIVKQEFEQGTGQSANQSAPKETAASISDIQQGTFVIITPQAENAKAAAKIVITQGFGMRGNRQNGQNPPDSGASSAPSSGTLSAPLPSANSEA